MKNFNKNAKKIKFLDSFPEISIENSDIESRFKFNFSFFDDAQEHGSAFNDLGAEGLASIMEKIKSYTRHDLNYWRHQRCGGHGLKILADYGSFPPRSNFTHPKSVPHNVNWCRFRMENLSRLIGFTIPSSYLETPKTNCPPYDTNTFYLVFIDPHHNFFLSENQ
jgi:hypothetical protein